MPLVLIFLGTLITFILVISSFVLLILQFSSKIDLKDFYLLDYKYLFLVIILFLLYHFWDALRLKTIAAAYRINYSPLYAYITSFVATFGATVTPAHIGGELIIFYMLKRLKVKNHKILGTILFKTISGFSFFLISAPIILIYSISNQIYLKKLFLLIIIFFLFLILFFPLLLLFKNTKMYRHAFIKKFRLYCYSLLFFWKYKRIIFLKASIYSILLYFTLLNFAPILLKALHIPFNWLEIYLIQLPLIYAIFSSPTPGGSGVGELGAAAIFTGLLPENLLGVFIILWRFFSQYLGATIGGFLFISILLKDLRVKE